MITLGSSQKSLPPNISAGSVQPYQGQFWGEYKRTISGTSFGTISGTILGTHLETTLKTIFGTISVHFMGQFQYSFWDNFSIILGTIVYQSLSMSALPMGLIDFCSLFYSSL